MWQEAGELYARFGNPSGGMVHNDMPAEKPAAESVKAEPAKEDKKSLWQEAKEMYAAYGNPSGGMVHNDMPAKNDAAKAVVAAKRSRQGR